MNDTRRAGVRFCGSVNDLIYARQGICRAVLMALRIRQITYHSTLPTHLNHLDSVDKHESSPAQVQLGLQAFFLTGLVQASWITTRIMSISSSKSCANQPMSVLDGWKMPVKV